MEDDAVAGSNLALVVGEASSCEETHIVEMTRIFLAHEYQHVLHVLKSHRPVLDAIASQLMWDPIVDQTELADLFRQYSDIPNLTHTETTD